MMQKENVGNYEKQIKTSKIKKGKLTNPFTKNDH
jgi:hypothetical protein